MIGRGSDHPRKTSQPSYWSMWTRYRPAPQPVAAPLALSGAPEDFQQQSFSVAVRQLNFCSCFGTTHFDLRLAQRGLSSTHRGWGRFHSDKFSNPASRSAKMPAAFCLALPLPGRGGHPIVAINDRSWLPHYPGGILRGVRCELVSPCPRQTERSQVNDERSGYRRPRGISLPTAPPPPDSPARVRSDRRCRRQSWRPALWFRPLPAPVPEN